MVGEQLTGARRQVDVPGMSAPACPARLRSWWERTALTGYIARRFTIAIPTLLVISIVLFSLLHLAPGGPMAMYAASPQARPAQLEEIERRLGLRDPLPVRVREVALWDDAGDWGLSYKYTRAVSAVIAERIGPSLQLMGASLLIALVLAIPFGMLAAVSRWRVMQYGVSLISMLEACRSRRSGSA